MKIPRIKKVNFVIFILAISALLTAISSFLIKYFRSGETDFSVLLGILFIPAIVIVVLKLNQPKEN